MDVPVEATTSDDKSRRVAIDGRLADLDREASQELLPLISESWTDHFKWRGRGPRIAIAAASSAIITPDMPQSEEVTDLMGSAATFIIIRVEVEIAIVVRAKNAMVEYDTIGERRVR